MYAGLGLKPEENIFIQIVHKEFWPQIVKIETRQGGLDSRDKVRLRLSQC